MNFTSGWILSLTPSLFLYYSLEFVMRYTNINNSMWFKVVRFCSSARINSLILWYCCSSGWMLAGWLLFLLFITFTESWHYVLIYFLQCFCFVILFWHRKTSTQRLHSLTCVCARARQNDAEIKIPFQIHFSLGMHRLYKYSICIHILSLCVA